MESVSRPKTRVAPEVRKRQRRLYLAAEWLEKAGGEGYVGFLTITEQGGPGRSEITPQETLKRWNSMLTNELRERYPKGGFRVIEAHADGTPHIHVVVGLPFDAKTGTTLHKKNAVPRWQVFAGYNKRLQQENRDLNLIAAKYGFGHIDLQPVRDTVEALGYYLSGYLSKSPIPQEWGRVRSFDLFGEVRRRIGGCFMWLSFGSWYHRRKMEFVGDMLGWKYEDFPEYLGPRWFWMLKHQFEEVQLPEFIRGTSKFFKDGTVHHIWESLSKEETFMRRWKSFGRNAPRVKAALQGICVKVRELLVEQAQWRPYRPADETRQSVWGSPANEPWHAVRLVADCPF